MRLVGWKGGFWFFFFFFFFHVDAREPVGSERTTLLHGETCKSIQSATIFSSLLSIHFIIHLGEGGNRTLLVVTTGDLEQVTLELIAEGVADNLIVKNPISPFVLRNCICVFDSCVHVHVHVGERRENFGFVENVCMLEFGGDGDG